MDNKIIIYSEDILQPDRHLRRYLSRALEEVHEIESRLEINIWERGVTCVLEEKLKVEFKTNPTAIFILLLGNKDLNNGSIIGGLVNTVIRRICLNALEEVQFKGLLIVNSFIPRKEYQFWPATDIEKDKNNVKAAIVDISKVRFVDIFRLFAKLRKDFRYFSEFYPNHTTDKLTRGGEKFLGFILGQQIKAGLADLNFNLANDIFEERKIISKAMKFDIKVQFEDYDLGIDSD
jgi:hypothetical protein